MSETRFELEQKIHDCWDVTKDLETLYNRSDGITTDELMNVLCGLIQLYKWKFDDTFKTFEKMIQEQRGSGPHVM